ncbi:MAG: Bax inhibitor-1/YccA family protein, partial [Saprospiraceae bacterium]|nr:Bax inhibitor-1/YccA family protein [Saprospiraceae bacterium]
MRRNNSFFKSHNPVMSESTYQKTAQESAVQRGEAMTVQGAINKTFILSAILILTAVYAFSNPSQLIMWGGAIGGLIVVLVAAFKPHLSPTLAPIYAALEGLFVGAISAYYAGWQDGIIFHAVSLTISVLLIMLFIYKSGLIKVTQKFRTGVYMATGGILLVYLLNIVLGLFGINMPFLHETGPIGIGISLLIIGVAALNLL